MAGLLRDRLVMVGASITSTGDLVQSPVHGLIPGVYLHAMALDNLIYKGMDYDREPANFSLQLALLVHHLHRVGQELLDDVGFGQHARLKTKGSSDRILRIVESPHLQL